MKTVRVIFLKTLFALVLLLFALAFVIPALSIFFLIAAGAALLLALGAVPFVYLSDYLGRFRVGSYKRHDPKHIVDKKSGTSPIVNPTGRG